VPKLNLRNAFLRGWFAARADRDLPQPDDLPEKMFIDRGYEAGVASGGRALPMLENPQAAAPRLSEADFDALLEAYRARKAAMETRAESPPSEAPPMPESLIAGSEAAPPEHAEPSTGVPAATPGKSRWDDDKEDAPDPRELTQTSPGRKRRYGH